MFNLLLSHSRKARIWISDLPEGVLLEPSSHVERRFSSNTRLGDSRKIAIELFIPRGARFDCGLIGGEFVPNESNEFVTTVCHSIGARVLADSLVDSLDEVKVGLPLDYADAVLEGIAAESTHSALPTGHLRVGCAAYGRFGSSVFFFKLLGKILFRMMTDSAVPSYEKEWSGYVNKLIQECSRRRARHLNSPLIPGN